MMYNSITLTMELRLVLLVAIQRFQFFTIIPIQSYLSEVLFLFIYFLFYLYIYPPDSQESDGGANTLPRPASGDTKILLYACNLIEI